MSSMSHTRHTKLPGWAHCDAYRAAVSAVAEVLEGMADRMQGARVEWPAQEPREPEFYVAALRVPGDDKQGARPAMLVYVLSPDWFAKEPTGQITYVAALGAPTAAISIRRFLRTWHVGRLGGETVYEGDLLKDALSEQCALSAERFFERRKEIETREHELGTILVWPITGYAPKLCTYCLIPSGQGVCPRCGRPTVARSSASSHGGR